MDEVVTRGANEPALYRTEAATGNHQQISFDLLRKLNKTLLGGSFDEFNSWLQTLLFESLLIVLEEQEGSLFTSFAVLNIGNGNWGRGISFIKVQGSKLEHVNQVEFVLGIYNVVDELLESMLAVGGE